MRYFKISNEGGVEKGFIFLHHESDRDVKGSITLSKSIDVSDAKKILKKTLEISNEEIYMIPDSGLRKHFIFWLRQRLKTKLIDEIFPGVNYLS